MGAAAKGLGIAFSPNYIAEGAHGTGNDAVLVLACSDGTFTVHPHSLAEMILQGRVVVMGIDFQVYGDIINVPVLG